MKYKRAPTVTNFIYRLQAMRSVAGADEFGRRKYMNVAQRMIEDGFATQEDTKLLTDVSDILECIHPQIQASVFHSGGGNFGILVTKQDGTTVLWGDCDGFWAADASDVDGDFIDSILTETPFTDATVEEAVRLIKERS